MKRFLLIIFCLIALQSVEAQTVVRGIVIDSVSGERLPQASVQLMRNGKPIAFTRTDNNGSFSLQTKGQGATDSLQVAYMGYRKTRVPAFYDKSMTVRMAEEAFRLKEVTVKAGRITAKPDTLTYDLTRYADARDNNLQDVLKKLPGVDVDENGKISYNGKSISRFTVENLDMTGGRYNQLTEGIKAQDVLKADFIQHDQPIKALQGKALTDDIGVNITLKDGARDKWRATIAPYLNYGDYFSVGGDIDLIQIGKRRQVMYGAAYDRTGRNLERQFFVLGMSGTSGVGQMPSWISAPSLSAPIDENRLRFNTSQKYKANAALKPNEDTELRVSTNYSRAVIRQHTENSSVYNFGENNIVETRENGSFCTKKDKLNIEAEYKKNKDKFYTENTFSVNAEKADGTTQYLTTLDTIVQRARVPLIDIANQFSRIITRGENIIRFYSTVDFHTQPASLYINKVQTDFKSTLWHANNSLSWTMPIRFMRLHTSAGVEVEDLNMQGDNPHFSLYARPSLEIERKKWDVSFTPALAFDRFISQNQSFVLFSPSARFSLRPSARSEWYFYTTLQNHAGGWSQFVLDRWQSDYRTWVTSCQMVPRTTSFLARLSYDYKRVVQEFFFSTEASYGRSQNNLMTDMQIVDGQYELQILHRNNHSSNISAGASVSKGFSDQHLKLSLEVDASQNMGQQLSGGTLYDYSLRTFTLNPKVILSPTWCEITYEGRMNWYANSYEDAPYSTTFSHRQSLSLTATIGKIDLTASGVYHYNQLDDNSSADALLADVKATWRLKKVRMILALNNIFNKRNYKRTTYNSIGTFTNTWQLRPRELKLTIQFSI